MLVAAITCVVGFVIASRRPQNPIGSLALAAGALLAVSFFSHDYAVRALLAAPGSLPGGHLAMCVFSVDRDAPLDVPGARAAAVP